ncbi:hypothetical protein ACI79J_04260 [Geodermatophilus sp. SYSU D01062]
MLIVGGSGSRHLLLAHLPLLIRGVAPPVRLQAGYHLDSVNDQSVDIVGPVGQPCTQRGSYRWIRYPQARRLTCGFYACGRSVVAASMLACRGELHVRLELDATL